MTRRELALLQTARSTNLCLDRYQNSWKDLPGFVQHREVIQTQITELEACAGEAAADRGNLVGQRQMAIQALAEAAWIVAGQVQAWAAAHGEEELCNSVRVTRDGLVWLQLGLPESALQIHQRGTECLRHSDGADYGLTREGLERLAELIQAVKILRVPFSRRTDRAPAGDGALDAGLNQVMDLLCEVADPLMRRFRVEDPEFYEAYQAARRIVDPETGTLVNSDEELASLDLDFPIFPEEKEEGTPQMGSDWRPVGSGTRSKKAGAALNS